MTTDTLKGTARRQLEEILTDPTRFARGILGSDVWEVSNQILQAIAKPHARVAVRACHASSKTFTAGLALAWFMTRYPDAICPTTAPTWLQVKDLLWKEIHAAVARSKIDYPEIFTTDWRWSADHYATGVSTTESERFQGFHAPHVLIIVDEAPGVRDPIWEAIEGIAAGGDVRILALGNPTISQGAFHRAFTTARSGWKTFTIDAFDTPNFKDIPGVTWREKIDQLIKWEDAEIGGGPDAPEATRSLNEAPRPYLITRRWVLQRYHEWGPNSPLWQARVRGVFPTKSADSLIALEWAENIQYNDHRAGGRTLGVDVARYGSNYTSYTLLHGNKIARMWRYQGRDTVETAGEIAKLYNSDPTLNIVVDDSGVGGGVVDMLNAQSIPVIPFNAGEVPRNPNGDTHNRGSEAYWSLAESLRLGEVAMDLDTVSVDVRELLIQQLVQIDYKLTVKGKIQVAKTGLKDDKPSPDFADSLNMAWEARRLESFSPELSSVQIPPEIGSGYSIREERSKMWGGWRGQPMDDSGNFAVMNPSLLGDGRRGMGGGVGMGGSNVPLLNAPAVVQAVCPSCSTLANLSELGRVGDMRNFKLSCPNCGLDTVIKQNVKGSPQS